MCCLNKNKINMGSKERSCCLQAIAECAVSVIVRFKAPEVDGEEEVPARPSCGFRKGKRTCNVACWSSFMLGRSLVCVERNWVLLTEFLALNYLSAQSTGSGQWLQKCGCKGNCVCVSKRAVFCNSKCLMSKPCYNKCQFAYVTRNSFSDLLL
jgi:hypothetical protein